MSTYNTHMAHPFEWKKGVRFYKRLKDKIAARSELQSLDNGLHSPPARMAPAATAGVGKCFTAIASGGQL